MLEEKAIFVEKELGHWSNPGSPKPGYAFVFVGHGQNSLVVNEGERGLTKGDLILGKYHTLFEVDIGDRLLKINESLSSSDGFDFNADVTITYAVCAPIQIVRRARKDINRFLKDLVVNTMRTTSRSYAHTQITEAEDKIALRVSEEISNQGFKLCHRPLVNLSVDDRMRKRIGNRILQDYDFEDKKLEISRSTELKGLEQTNKLNRKGERAAIFAPLIRAGDWATLLGMLDSNDPEDEAIKTMIEATLNQQKLQADKQQKILEIAIEQGAIEGWQLEEVAKALIHEICDLSGNSIALLEGKNESEEEDGHRTRDAKSSIPDEIKRDQWDSLNANANSVSSHSSESLSQNQWEVLNSESEDTNLSVTEEKTYDKWNF